MHFDGVSIFGQQRFFTCPIIFCPVPLSFWEEFIVIREIFHLLFFDTVTRLFR